MLRDVDEHWDDPARRQRMLSFLRHVEGEPSMLGTSAHIMAIGRKVG
ncbi:MAG TPA: hypothetical protein VFI27_18010 [candidate division Zixibacteria bacterium]|nr:hypothetical protein [candidate division Zixibacteria bacterium]